MNKSDLLVMVVAFLVVISFLIWTDWRDQD